MSPATSAAGLPARETHSRLTSRSSCINWWRQWRRHRTGHREERKREETNTGGQRGDKERKRQRGEKERKRQRGEQDRGTERRERKMETKRRQRQGQGDTIQTDKPVLLHKVVETGRREVGNAGTWLLGAIFVFNPNRSTFETRGSNIN